MKYCTVYCVFREADLVVEVAHPDVTVQYGAEILRRCDYMVSRRQTSLHCCCH